jgi:hypothetical protein
MAQRDIMRNMEAICTLKYSFKLPSANTALQKIHSDSHCPCKKREGRYLWWQNPTVHMAIDWAMAQGGLSPRRTLFDPRTVNMGF